MFLAITESGGFTRAAKRIGMSQSAVSQQISALEEELGLPLFVRQRSGVQTTRAGDLLESYAKQIVARLDELRRRLADLDESRDSDLVVGTCSSFTAHVLPTILRNLRMRYPDLRIRVRQGSAEETLSLLADRRIEAGIVVGPVERSSFRWVELGRDELVAITATGHRWAGRARVSASDLAREPLMAISSRSGTLLREVETWLLEAGEFPRLAGEVDEIESAVGMVRAGFGVAVVPGWVVKEEIALGRLLTFPLERGPSRRWGLVLSEDLGQDRRLRALSQLCSDLVPGILGG